MNEITEVQLSDMLDMLVGTFPIPYLGVPLHGKRLRSNELQGLVHKLTNKVRGWEAMLVDFA